jgi:hypothetical protein
MKKHVIGFIPRKLFPDVDGHAAGGIHSYTTCLSPNTIKSWRGFENILTARLMCPVDYLEAMKADPEQSADLSPPEITGAADRIILPRTRQNIVERKLHLVDSEGDPKFPVFLYDEELMDNSITKGLFRGPVLLMVGLSPSPRNGSLLTTNLQAYKHMFISPSAATGARQSSKRGNGEKHGMTKVLPSTICYAAVQVCVDLPGPTSTFDTRFSSGVHRTVFR